MKFLLIIGTILSLVFSKYQWVEYWAESSTLIWQNTSIGTVVNLNVIAKSKLRKAFVNTIGYSGTGTSLKANSTAYTRGQLKLTF